MDITFASNVVTHTVWSDGLIVVATEKSDGSDPRLIAWDFEKKQTAFEMPGIPGTSKLAVNSIFDLLMMHTTVGDPNNDTLSQVNISNKEKPVIVRSLKLEGNAMGNAWSSEGIVAVTDVKLSWLKEDFITINEFNKVEGGNPCFLPIDDDPTVALMNAFGDVDLCNLVTGDCEQRSLPALGSNIEIIPQFFLVDLKGEIPDEESGTFIKVDEECTLSPDGLGRSTLACKDDSLLAEKIGSKHLRVSGKEFQDKVKLEQKSQHTEIKDEGIVSLDAKTDSFVGANGFRSLENVDARLSILLSTVTAKEKALFN